MPFDIRFLPAHLAPHISVNDARAPGRVRFGHFTEHFLASLGYWGVADYEESWRTGIGRILSGEARSALVTDIDLSLSQGTIAVFGLWRTGEEVAIQQVLVPVRSSRAGSVDVFTLLGERSPSSEVSEWRVSVGDLRHFLNEEA